jgi:hypothetical protein
LLRLSTLSTVMYIFSSRASRLSEWKAVLWHELRNFARVTRARSRSCGARCLCVCDNMMYAHEVSGLEHLYQYKYVNLRTGNERNYCWFASVRLRIATKMPYGHPVVFLVDKVKWEGRNSSSNRSQSMSVRVVLFCTDDSTAKMFLDASCSQEGSND